MLKYIRQRLFRASAFEGREALVAWCESSGWTMRGIREQEGFVIDTRGGVLEGRIEWGPAQRRYLGSHELRLRGEIDLKPEVHALVMPQSLMEEVERELFSQYVGGVQTRLDEETPEEMRWLAMHPKLSPNQMGVALRDRYGAVGSDAEWVSRWLAGPISDALKARADELPLETVAAEPILLRLARGQVVLRQSASRPTVPELERCIAVAAAVDIALHRTA